MKPKILTQWLPRVKRLVFIGILIKIMSVAGVSQASFFISLDSLDHVNDVSGDGTVVAGFSYFDRGTGAVRWMIGGDITGLGDLPGGRNRSLAYDLSGDGAVVVGESNSVSGQEAFRWTSGTGMEGLGDLPGGEFMSHAYGVSGDGAVVVGLANSETGREAFLWTADGGMTGLGVLPGGEDSQAHDVSGDGSVVIGDSDSASGTQAFRWTAEDGMVGLGFIIDGGDNNWSWCTSVSEDGTAIVGQAESSSGAEPFRWTAEDGMTGLGSLTEDSVEGVAYDVSGDGSVVVGKSIADFGGGDYNMKAFIWDELHGMMDLQEVLTDSYGLDLTGWSLRDAVAISDDGRTIVGRGVDHSDGEYKGWMAYLQIFTMADLLSFYYDSIDIGLVEGLGRTEVISRRHLMSFKKILLVAKRQIKNGEAAKAGITLNSAILKCDGDDDPPDLIGGKAVKKLNYMLRALMEEQKRLSQIEAPSISSGSLLNKRSSAAR
jgi:probable HAF family extracellular repeat protein